MSEAVDTIQHNGYTIEIHHDYDAESPREWGNIGTMVCSHRCYNLGDVQGNGDDVPVGAITLPLYLYDHSGITMSTSSFSCQWDSGRIGTIYCTRDKALAEFGGKRLTKQIRDKVIKAMQCEVETYDMFLTGQVYGYIVKDDEDNYIKSCWGFYGMKHCVESAKEACQHVEPAFSI